MAFVRSRIGRLALDRGRLVDRIAALEIENAELRTELRKARKAASARAYALNKEREKRRVADGGEGGVAASAS